MPIAGRDIVAAGIAEHVVESVFLGHVFARLADDHRQLAFVIDLRALELRRQDDRVAGVLHGSRVFHEQHGVLRNRVLPFFRMPFVVEADAKEGRRLNRREELFDIRLAVAHRELAVDIAVDFEGRAVGLLRTGVGGATGVEVTDDAHE